MDKVLCLNCGKYEGFYFKEEASSIEYKGEIVNYTAKKAYCNKCNEEVDVPGLWDENLKRIKEAYFVPMTHFDDPPIPSCVEPLGDKIRDIK